MVDSMPDKLHHAIVSAEGDTVVHQYEILNRSQQRLERAEEELRADRQQKREVDERIRKNRENLANLTKLIERDEAVSRDLQVSIFAGLASIDSMRKSGVELPPQVQEAAQ